MAAALGTLAHAGLPFFADSPELVESQLRYLLRSLPEGQQRTDLLAVQRRQKQVFEVAMPSGHFFAVAGLPRPSWRGEGTGPLSVTEIRALLRPD